MYKSPFPAAADKGVNAAVLHAQKGADAHLLQGQQLGLIGGRLPLKRYQSAGPNGSNSARLRQILLFARVMEIYEDKEVS